MTRGKVGITVSGRIKVNGVTTSGGPTRADSRPRSRSVLVPLPLLLLGAVAVVVPGVPVRIHLHVLLTFDPRLLIVLGLLIPT